MLGLRLCALVLEAVLVLLFLLTGSRPVLACALGLLLPVLCAVIIHLMIRKKLRVSLETPMNIRKGEQGQAAFLLENPTVFPILRLRCRLRAENRLNGQSLRLTVSGSVMPKSRCRIPVEIGSRYCGRVRLQVEKLYLYDCFGILPVTCTPEAHKSSTVQPETFEQNIRLGFSAAGADDSDRYAENRPGFDLSEPFQVREYSEGDSPRQIHWKLSGKFDRLIVRDPSLPVARSVLVFWERTGQSNDPALTDAQAEAVASVGRALVQQSVRFTLGWNENGRCILHDITEMEDLIGVLPSLFRAAGARMGIPGPELLMQTLAPGAYAHILFIGEDIPDSVYSLRQLSQVTVVSCGNTAPEDAIRFTAHGYAAELALLEL